MDTDTCWVQLGLKQGDEALNIKVVHYYIKTKLEMSIYENLL